MNSGSIQGMRSQHHLDSVGSHSLEGSSETTSSRSSSETSSQKTHSAALNRFSDSSSLTDLESLFSHSSSCLDFPRVLSYSESENSIRPTNIEIREDGDSSTRSSDDRSSVSDNSSISAEDQSVSDDLNLDEPPSKMDKVKSFLGNMLGKLNMGTIGKVALVAGFALGAGIGIGIIIGCIMLAPMTGGLSFMIMIGAGALALTSGGCAVAFAMSDVLGGDQESLDEDKKIDDLDETENLGGNDPNIRIQDRSTKVSSHSDTDSLISDEDENISTDRIESLANGWKERDRLKNENRALAEVNEQLGMENQSPHTSKSTRNNNLRQIDENNRKIRENDRRIRQINKEINRLANNRETDSGLDDSERVHSTSDEFHSVHEELDYEDEDLELNSDQINQEIKAIQTDITKLQADIENNQNQIHSLHYIMELYEASSVKNEQTQEALTSCYNQLTALMEKDTQLSQKYNHLLIKQQGILLYQANQSRRISTDIPNLDHNYDLYLNEIQEKLEILGRQLSEIDSEITQLTNNQEDVQRLKSLHVDKEILIYQIDLLEVEADIFSFKIKASQGTIQPADQSKLRELAKSIKDFLDLLEDSETLPVELQAEFATSYRMFSHEIDELLTVPAEPQE